MAKATKHKIVKSYNVKKELAKVDQVFRSIEKDKSVPTFCDFFMQCLISGHSENVNLKIMYPKIHKKLANFLEEHTATILALRK